MSLPVGRKPRRDDEFEARIDGLDARGGATARWGEYRVRFRHALPGQVVHAQVTRRRGDRIDARILRELEPAPNAVAPRCAHFASCGGCTLQDLAYEAQLEELRALLGRLLGEAAPPVASVVPCEDPWAYRNKMDFTFANRRWIEPGEAEDAPNGFALGLHAPGRHDKVLDVGRCDIQFPEANGLLATARRAALELELPPWDLTTHTGLLRHLVLRKGFHSGEILVDLVTSEEATEVVGPWVGAMLAAHPEITTLVQNVNTRGASIAVGERELVHFGPGRIRERLRGLEFEISANSFFQTNTLQAERLLDLVIEEAALEASTRVWDLYCGTGTFSLALARDGHEVVGFELAPSSIDDAERNAERNDVGGCAFVAGDLADTLPAFLERTAERPEVCVVDPPRAGLHPRVLTGLLGLGARRLVYVSCNPTSVARELPSFLAAGYRLARVRPIDLFPHTMHVETVLTFERAGGPEAG